VGWGWKIDVGGLGRLLKSPWTAFHGSLGCDVFIRRPTQRSGWAWKIDVGWGWKMGLFCFEYCE